jgi:hypothetical protein
MALDWYTRDLDKGLEGQIADSTSNTIDSFAIELVAGAEAGQPVIRGTIEGTVKVPIDDAGAAKVIGITVHTHKEPQTPYYKQYDSVPVKTNGDIYVKVGTAVVAGDAAGILGSAGVYSFCPSTTALSIAIANATFLDSAAIGGLTRLRIRK